ncbi:feruloyl esterase-like protein [Rhodotorula toruloides]|uniref:Carboxylic ester hydrolase n=1 Tax=Rhodotorula toruloides TaxID=5286 RepID=A0A511K6Y7_RHOTO|nr:feruloyl esterase-like protein [Rhodotorula toruloides]
MKSTIASLVPLALAGSALGAALPSGKTSCHDLWTKAPKHLPSLEVYYANDVAAGTNFTTPYATPAYPQPVPDVPAFCRFGAYIHTSNSSKVQFEVWLPTADQWSGRFAMVGNGGDAGGVNFPDMWAPIAKYGFAVASTDTGHNGTAGDGTFALQGPETQIDFGYRAVHLTTVYSKEILKLYYGKKQKTSYWLGCSSGGKQGLKEVQMFPDDYDGVIAGSAAQWWPHLNGQTYRINALVNPTTSPDYLNVSDYLVIGAEVYKQCDELDGVKDGVIGNPRKCKPDLSPLLCSAPGANQSTCLTQGKIDTMHTIWANWTATTRDEFLFYGFEPGAEAAGKVFSVNGLPFGPGPDYFRYQVLNESSIGTFSANETELERLLAIADSTDPGMTNAWNPNIQRFLKKGKLITYVGLADTLIPTGSTIGYYERVRSALGQPKNFNDAYRLFTVPGMWHCSGGPGAYNFGGPGQRQLVLGGVGQGSSFDASHDMILSIIDWVEKGRAPDSLIASKYNGGDKRNGTAFERPLCVYPKEAVYIGGDQNKASSFECKYVG